MSFLTRYGTQFGAIPMTAGTVHWVAPSTTYTVAGQSYIADDGNNGLSPEQALRHISQAVLNASASTGDVIALLPGTHTTLSALPVNKAGLTFVGLPYYAQETAWTTRVQPQVTIIGTAAIGTAVTAADCAFYNIRFVPITQFAAATYSAAASRLVFKHCMIDMTVAVGHANTKGIVSTTAAVAPDKVSFIGNWILGGIATTSCGVAIDVGAGTNFLLDRNLIEHDGFVASAVDWTAAVQFNDNCYGTVRSNDLVGHNVAVKITKCFVGITHAGAGAVHFISNTSTVNTSGLLISGWAAADVDLCLNYVATVSGGTGGSLITIST